MKIYPINKELYLKRVSIENAKDLFEIASNPNVTKYMRYETHKNIDETKKVINNIFSKDQAPWSHLGIFLNNKMIGEISISDAEHKNELGYQLNEAYWGLGIVSKAVIKIISIFFEDSKNNEIYVNANFENKASWEVIKKVGFIDSNIARDKDTNWWVFTREMLNKKII